MKAFLPDIQIIDFMSASDWLVFILVLIITLGSVVYGEVLKRKQDLKENESFLDLLLLGRQLTLPMFIATLVATWYGGIFGVTEISFKYGIYNFITQGVFWYVTYIIFALFFVEKIRKYEAVTLPDLVGKMFGPKAEKVAAVFNLFNIIPIAYIMSLGLFLQGLFGGSYSIMMFVGLLVVIGYSLLGGFRAVVFSDLVQFFVMCSSVLLILLFSLHYLGGPGFLISNLPDQHFSLTGGNSLWKTFAWGFIALSTLVDPNFYQRCFAAQSNKVAKRGILLATCVWVVFDICTTAGGLYARAVMPDAPSSKAYLFFGVQLLPDGLRGFFLAGILATILSTLDSYLFLAATTFSYDLLPKKFNLLKKTTIHHLSLVIMGLIAIGLGSIFQGDIRNVWKTLGSYSAACMLIPIMFGHLLPGRFKEKNFLWAAGLGVLATTFWRWYPLPESLSEIDDLYIGCTASLLGLWFSRSVVFTKSPVPPKST